MSGRQDRPRREPEDGLGTPLDGLLEEMRELRLTLAADLTVAAGAADAGADEVVGDIVEADRFELARFARIADQRLRELSAGEPAAVGGHSDEGRSTWRRRVAVALPVVPVVSALALSAAAATGALPLPGAATHHAQPPSTAASASTPTAGQAGVASTFDELASVIEANPHSPQVLAVASKLHHQIALLIADSPHNPAGAAEVAQLLHMEQALLRRAQPAGVSAMLKATRRLAARLITVAPELVSPTTQPTGIPTVVPSHKPTHSASPKPSASAKSTPKPTTTPAPSKSAQPSGQPTPPWPGIPN